MIFNLIRKYSAWSDDELVKSYQKSGDVARIAVLFDRYADVISLICLNYLKNKQDAEDSFMDLFEQVCQDLKKTEVTHFSAWMNAVVRHHCLKVKRQREKWTTTGVEEHAEDTWKEEFSFHEENAPNSSRAIENAMLTLKPDQAKCIHLFYTEQKSYKEISEMLDLDMNTVKSHIQNGKRKLKIELEKQNITYHEVDKR